MRKSSLAAVFVVLLVGLAAAYRAGRVQTASETSPRPRGEGGEPRSGSIARVDERHDPPSASTPPQQRTPGQEIRAAERRSVETASPAPKEPHEQATSPALAAPAAVTQAPVEPQASGQAAPRDAAPVGSSSNTQRPGSPAAPPDPTKDKTAATADDPESDRRAPVLEFLRFDPPEIQDGAAAVLSIGASDDLAGVASVVGQIRSPTQDAVTPFVARDQGGTGVFTASISIPRHAQTGDWFVGLIQIVDKASNPFNASYARATVPAGGVLRVVSAESDSTPPTVDRVFLEKPTVAGGEKNQVVVEATDDRSGVAAVSGWFQSASKSARIPFNCPGNTAGPWVGDLPVPTDAECGEWSLWQLRVTDKAQNSAVISGDSPQLGHVSFMVAGGGGCDSDPPVLDGVIVTPATVSNASDSEVTLAIAAHDQGSGLATLEGRVEGPIPPGGQAPRIFFSAHADPQNPDAPIVVKIVVPRLAAHGLWHVAVLNLTDKARNARTYSGADPALANAYFNVE